ncbi:NADPH:quinone reductase [Gleimia hominis]|uniref:NADPH:quinone reductase n=1 Tax=Gleimia hominis TaxID=595468 RepID=UPI000C8039F8|nr:NADPH:quinone reductase [Gleimia hominis]WIK64752.1 NADPH:quinone reductase [Gleimia hominis]
MKAAVVKAVGPASNIVTGDVPVPVLQAGQVLVRFIASEVNHVDLFVRSGAYRTPLPTPFAIGRDLVGQVEQSEDSAFAPGDLVWTNSLGYAGRNGTYSQFVCVDANRLYPLPEGVEPRDAAVVLHGGLTAYLGWFREGGLTRGQTVVIGGGSGAVGSAAIQMASHAGARVIATASARNHGYCRELGADTVVDYHDENWVHQVRAAASEGVDIWWQTASALDASKALELMNHGGKLLLTAGMQDALQVPVGGLYTRDCSIRGFAASNASVSDLRAAAEHINAGLAAHELRGRVALSLPLDRAREAHEALESGSVRDGRILMTSFQEG